MATLEELLQAAKARELGNLLQPSQGTASAPVATPYTRMVADVARNTPVVAPRLAPFADQAALHLTPPPAARAPAAPAAPVRTLDQIIAQNRAANPVGTVPRAAPPAPTMPMAGQTRFDVTNTNRTTGASSLPSNPNVNYTSIPVPASLSAPAFGATPAPAETGPTLISIDDSAADPTNPSSRMFDPRAAQLQLRQNALDVQRANALTEAQGRLGVANIGADAELARTNLAGQYGLQERALATEGALATTDLAGQYDLAKAEATASAAVRAATVKAQQDNNSPESLKNLMEAQRIAFQVQGLKELAAQQGTTPEQLVAASRTGQETPQPVVRDYLGNPLGTVGPGGAINNVDNFAAIIKLLQQLQTTPAAQ